MFRGVEITGSVGAGCLEAICPCIGCERMLQGMVALV